MCFIIVIDAHGNDSAVRLRAPPFADLHSAPLNQASILWYYTYIIYHSSLQMPLSPTVLHHHLILWHCVFYKKHRGMKYMQVHVQFAFAHVHLLYHCLSPMSLSYDNIITSLFCICIKTHWITHSTYVMYIHNLFLKLSQILAGNHQDGIWVCNKSSPSTGQEKNKMTTNMAYTKEHGLCWSSLSKWFLQNA